GRGVEAAARDRQRGHGRGDRGAVRDAGAGPSCASRGKRSDARGNDGDPRARADADGRQAARAGHRSGDGDGSRRRGRQRCRGRDRTAAVARAVMRAPRGTEISCKGWPQEAALRMLHNNLDPDVAERPEDLVVYGGTGKAARSWDAFDGIVRDLRALENDETLLIQSGKAVGKLRTHPDAP